MDFADLAVVLVAGAVIVLGLVMLGFVVDEIVKQVRRSKREKWQRQNWGNWTWAGWEEAKMGANMDTNMDAKFADWWDRTIRESREGGSNG